MLEHYSVICDTILKFKESKDAIVRKAVITLIPHMAAYDPASFCQDDVSPAATSFLTTSMRHLLSQLKRPDKALGALIIISRHIINLTAVHLSLHLYRPCRRHGPDRDETVLGRDPHSHQGRAFHEGVSRLCIIRRGDSADTFSSVCRKKNAPPEDPIFQCIGMLAKAFGVILTKHMHDLLDLMFASGLGEPLRQALEVTAASIKPLQRTIQGQRALLLAIATPGL